MCGSERYLQFLAASSHSSGPEFGFKRAGPGWGMEGSTTMLGGEGGIDTRVVGGY